MSDIANASLDPSRGAGAEYGSLSPFVALRCATQSGASRIRSALPQWIDATSLCLRHACVYITRRISIIVAQLVSMLRRVFPVGCLVPAPCASATRRSLSRQQKRAHVSSVTCSVMRPGSCNLEGADTVPSEGRASETAHVCQTCREGVTTAACLVFGTCVSRCKPIVSRLEPSRFARTRKWDHLNSSFVEPNRFTHTPK